MPLAAGSGGVRVARRANFRVRGKTFATYAVNHHGDGRVALWLNAVPGSQELHVRAEPAHFFVPPYVGPRGWLGVILDRGIAWKRVAALVREAYEKVAPAELRARHRQDAARSRRRPSRCPPAEIDPLQIAARARRAQTLRTMCLRLPESSEARQFGHPVWQAGKKTFAMARHDGGAVDAVLLGGRGPAGPADRGRSLSRFRPTWATTVGSRSMSARIATGVRSRAGCLQSYRHFALKRMLQQLAAQVS